MFGPRSFGSGVALGDYNNMSILVAKPVKRVVGASQQR